MAVGHQVRGDPSGQQDQDEPQVDPTEHAQLDDRAGQQPVEAHQGLVVLALQREGAAQRRGGPLPVRRDDDGAECVVIARPPAG